MAILKSIFTFIAKFAAKIRYKIFKPKPITGKYINFRGYIALSSTNEPEHRFIARQILGCDLEHNEIVHHINGNKVDNDIRNLCLMDREKHEHFHSWLDWKLKKDGYRPSFAEQRRVLEDEYGGTLLEDYNHKRYIKMQKQQRLFEELRKERKKIADLEGVAAFRVFKDITLIEMSEIMPDSIIMMSHLVEMTPEKLEKYGSTFLAIIKKFKNDFNINKKDPA
jgi:superfamily II DNA helicase RecQ